MYPNGYNCPAKKTESSLNPKRMNERILADFVKEMRKKFNLTQVDLAEKSGVGLRFVRDLEQGKQTLRLDKVNQVLQLFGRQAGPVEIDKA